MPSLLDLQQRFARSLRELSADDDPRIDIYRRNIAGNYRNALGATYRVVRELVGGSFFDAAVDTFVERHPSASGDLNVYGAQFADFLAAYPYAASLPYLPDVARLEWAIDESSRADDADGSVAAVIAALTTAGAEGLVAQSLLVAPSCRLLHSNHPILRIWQAHQSAHLDGEERNEIIVPGAGPDHLLVRCDATGVAIERVHPATFAWLAALLSEDGFTSALDAAMAIAPEFDLQGALATYIGNRTIVGIAADDVSNSHGGRLSPGSPIPLEPHP